MIPPRRLKRYINFWPPFLFTGIRLKYVSDDFREIDAELRLRWWNRNMVGTHFGGSLFAMTDAFYMLMLMANLGRDYNVWDKSAQIDFIAPGRGTGRAQFRLTESQLTEIRAATANGAKYLPEFTVNITNTQNELIATAKRTLYVRRKPTN
jgi:acyl-coenzyme A thioesterase PaaI-like protein